MKLCEILDPFEEPEGEDDLKQQYYAQSRLHNFYHNKVKLWSNKQYIKGSQPKDPTYFRVEMLWRKSAHCQANSDTWWISGKLSKDMRDKAKKVLTRYYETYTNMNELELQINPPGQVKRFKL